MMFVPIFFHQFCNDSGDAYLVANSCFNGDVGPDSIIEDEKKLILLITNLATKITRDERSLLTSILSLTEDVVKKDVL